MKKLNQHIEHYNQQLSLGNIQIAYRGIMVMMSQLKTMWDAQYPLTPSGSLYTGYMDMTFISVKPAVLSDIDLRVSIVYLHESHTFEAWLVARNRKIQSQIHNRLKEKEIGQYTLSELGPGIDAIISTILIADPDFDNVEFLIQEIMEKTQYFIIDMTNLVR
jgi:hypothetical protein